MDWKLCLFAKQKTLTHVLEKQETRGILSNLSLLSEKARVVWSGLQLCTTKEFFLLIKWLGF